MGWSWLSSLSTSFSPALDNTELRGDVELHQGNEIKEILVGLDGW